MNFSKCKSVTNTVTVVLWIYVLVAAGEEKTKYSYFHMTLVDSHSNYDSIKLKIVHICFNLLLTLISID